MVYKCKACLFQFDEFDAKNDYCCPKCEKENPTLKRDLELVQTVVASSSKRKLKTIPKFRETYFEK